MTPLCIIPARGGSKRFPGKNVAPVKGKPLIAYTIEAALGSGVFREVLVSTDDVYIGRVAAEFGAIVPFMRAPEYATDRARIVDVCLYTLDVLENNGSRYESLCVLQPTCPLRTSEDIKAAWELFEKSDAEFLVSVTDFDHPPFWALSCGEDGSVRPFWGLEFMKRAQELPRMVRPNGAIALASVKALRSRRSFYGPRLIGFHMPRVRSLDVDERDDLVLVECLMNAESKVLQ